MVSITTMIQQLAGLLGTNDLNEWEQGFVQNVWNTLQRRKGHTVDMTDKQVECVERIWRKHFAG